MDKELKIIPPEGYEVDKEHSTFGCIKFRPIKRQFPKSWEEFCEVYPIQEGEAYINNVSMAVTIDFSRNRSYSNKNILPSEEMAKAVNALCQLIQLRDYYNQGWKPKWNDHTLKYTIISTGNCSVEILPFYTMPRVLSFQNRKVCEEFYKNFRELIKVARPLL